MSAVGAVVMLELPEDKMVLASDKKKGKKFMEPSAGLAPLQRMEDAEATLDPEACRGSPAPS